MSSLRAADRDRDVVLMCEVADETTYVPHHRQKIVFLLSAMRHFAEALRADGWTVDYVRLDDPANTGSFTGEVGRALARHGADRLLVTEAGEWRVKAMIDGWAARFGTEVQVLPDRRFVCPLPAFEDWARDRKSLRMEYFYREMRRKTGLLMDGDKPAGGRWNFDAENRKPLTDDLFLPERRRFAPDAVTQEVIDLIAARFPEGFGDLEGFGWAVTRADAEAAFEEFLGRALARFGDHQDAMLAGRPFLYHGLISAYLNVGLLDALDVCRRVEAEWRAGRVPLNAAEGFIRQIIGWREYVRGIYWLKMPGYRDENALGATRPLPWFYWSGDTDMACMAEAIGQTRRHAYAHHIQRLMVTGTFALLAGIDPKALHEWYLAVYIDAFEWVELPNTLGMSQFADGGLLGSKPYAASGAYIDRMSDYCAGCRYDVTEKTGAIACPFNALYWDFLARNADRLRGNPRLGTVYATWDRMAEGKRDALRESAGAFLDRLDRDDAGPARSPPSQAG
ncbi:cryptochrome/photolyase family protein [Methylobrevis pamukkalensis]|nr:cryptochrome/photolyase family protein [Methylobrevis pamukkalensis]